MIPRYESSFTTSNPNCNPNHTGSATPNSSGFITHLTSSNYNTHISNLNPNDVVIKQIAYHIFSLSPPLASWFCTFWAQETRAFLSGQGLYPRAQRWTRTFSLGHGAGLLRDVPTCFAAETGCFWMGLSRSLRWSSEHQNRITTNLVTLPTNILVWSKIVGMGCDLKVGIGPEANFNERIGVVPPFIANIVSILVLRSSQLVLLSQYFTPTSWKVQYCAYMISRLWVDTTGAPLVPLALKKDLFFSGGFKGHFMARWGSKGKSFSTNTGPLSWRQAARSDWDHGDRPVQLAAGEALEMEEAQDGLMAGQIPKVSEY